MDITIIGTGNMARGIATRALGAGHAVTLLGTETEKALALAAELSGDVRAGRVGDPLAGDVIVLAVWFGAGSAAQEIAARASAARIVKAFNTTVAGTLAQGTVAGQPLDVLIASDDEDAKATVSSIVADSGLRPIDVGPLKRARELEALGYLHIAMQQPLESSYSSAVKVLS